LERIRPVSDVQEGIEDGPVPPGKHRLTVSFSHINHFSPDSCRLESKPVTIELGDEPIRRTSKPKPSRAL
jgi:hypothetical protein